MEGIYITTRARVYMIRGGGQQIQHLIPRILLWAAASEGGILSRAVMQLIQSIASTYGTSDGTVSGTSRDPQYVLLRHPYVTRSMTSLRACHHVYYVLGTYVTPSSLRHP